MVAAGARWWPATMSTRNWVPAVGFGIVAGCGAAFLGPQATAAAEFDTALVGISVAVVVVGSSRARAHWLVLAAVVVTIGAMGALPLGLAAAGLGGAAACALWPARIGWPKSAVVGCTMVAASHLDRPLPLGALTGLAMGGALIIAAAGHRNLRSAPRRRARIGVAIAVGIGGVAAACGAVALARSRADLTNAADDATAAATAARAGDTTTATARFAAAATRFGRAQSVLEGPLADIGSSVPVMAQHLRAGARLADAGRRLSRAGGQISIAADSTTFRLSGGKADLARISALSGPLADAEAAVAAASADTRAARSPWLVPVVSDGLDRLDRELAKAGRDLASAAAAATVLPPMLGAEKPQSYLVVLMAGAETRGSGGVAGSYATMTADGGALHVDRVGRSGDINLAKPPNVLHAPEEYVRRYGFLNPQTTFQNTNYTPDFPVAAKVMADLAGQALHRRFDGVVAIDPDGVAALLAVTGPATVGIPAALGQGTASTVAAGPPECTSTASANNADNSGTLTVS